MSLVDIKKIISANMKRYRETANLQKKDVAAYLGVGASSVTHWEDGSNSIDINRLAKLCELFGCNLADMVSENKVPSVTNEEMRLVEAYRSMPEMQEAVCRLLKIDTVTPSKIVAADISDTIEAAVKALNRVTNTN